MRNPEGFKTPVATCGCNWEISNNDEPRIIFCALHRNADKMLKALQSIRNLLNEKKLWTMLNEEIFNQAQTAITLAERED